ALRTAHGDDGGTGGARLQQDGAGAPHLLPGQLDDGLQVGVWERRQVEEAADRHRALDDVARQPVLAFPVRRQRHGGKMAASRMAGYRDFMRIPTELADVIESPGNCGPYLADDFSDRDTRAKIIVDDHGGAPERRDGGPKEAVVAGRKPPPITAMD